MSGSLGHSPADVVRHLLINLSLGTLPTDNGNWPVYTSQEPDSPDSVITVYDTAGRRGGRAQTDGQVQEHPGVQVRVRSINHVAGYTKARAIAVALDETAYRDSVTVGSNVYTVQEVSRVGGVLVLGEESPSSKRYLFTINAVVSLRQTT